MAGPVRLADVFIPQVYASYQSLDNDASNRLIRSGLVQTNAVLQAIARNGSGRPTVPFWRDIDRTIEPNYSNDDPADLAVPNKITTGTMTTRTAYLNQGFSEMDLVNELMNGASALRQIRNRTNEYWIGQQQLRVIAMAQGILADSVAAHGSDMLTDISTATGDAAKFGSDAFIDAVFGMGDRNRNIGGVGVHSMVMARMVKNDDIINIPDSQGNLTIPTYKGKLVFEDDDLPVTGSGANAVYTSILYGQGAFGFGGAEGNVFAIGEGVPKVPYEVLRSPRVGNGGGMEEFWERKTWIMHPFGYSWTDPTGADALVEYSPTLADLRKAAGWSRVTGLSRKRIPLAFIKSKA